MKIAKKYVYILLAFGLSLVFIFLINHANPTSVQAVNKYTPQTSLKDGSFKKGSAIIELNPGNNIKDFGFTKYNKINDKLNMYEVTFTGNTKQKLDDLYTNNKIKSVEPNYRCYTMDNDLTKAPNISVNNKNNKTMGAITPNDPYYPSQWALPQLDLPDAWGMTTGTRTIVIGIIDTGIYMNYTDFNYWTNPGNVAGDPYVGDTHGWDFNYNCPLDNYSIGTDNDGGLSGVHPTNWHGTGVAGCAAAIGNNGFGLAGTSWNTELANLKVSGDANGIIWDSSVIAAINYATIMKFPIINISLGSPYANLSMQAAIASYPGIAVCAAGNRGAFPENAAWTAANGNNEIAPVYPASFNLNNIVAVAASNSSDIFSTSVSCYGTTSVDVAAPGETVRVYAWNGAPYQPSPGYVVSGTSFATPYAAGVIALLKAYYPYTSNAQIINALFTTSEKHSTEYMQIKYGRVNAYLALQHLTTISISTTKPESADTPAPTPTPITKPIITNPPTDNQATFFQKIVMLNVSPKKITVKTKKITVIATKGATVSISAKGLRAKVKKVKMTGTKYVFKNLNFKKVKKGAKIMVKATLTNYIPKKIILTRK